MRWIGGLYQVAGIFFLVVGAHENHFPAVVAGLVFVGLAAICWRPSSIPPA